MKAQIYDGKNMYETTFDKGCLISEILNQGGITLAMPCGGKHLCKKCKVKVIGITSTPCKDETNFLSNKEIKNGIRFACMTKALSDLKIFLLEKDAKNISTFVTLPVPNSPMGKHLALAIDIGTTTIASCLYDIKTQTIISKKSSLNPQRFFGDNILTRLEKSRGSNDVSDCIKKHLISLTASYENHKDIDSVVISGNTAMLYLLFNLNSKELITPPFKIIQKFGIFIDNNKLNLPIDKNAKIYIPPCVSAFIGADTIGSLVSLSIPSNKNQLFIDMGTNGEIVLSKKDKLLCTSTALGSAFEGIGISHGSVACDGAIESAGFIGGHFKTKVIGNTPAKTICASGLIDILALMIKLNIVDKFGTINNQNNFTEFIHERENEKYFVIENTDVFITQSDIRALQLAKSAVKTGVEVLLDEIVLKTEELDEIILSGGFTSNLNVDNCITIGLLPNFSFEKFFLKGNTSLSGALKFLLDEKSFNNAKNTAESAMTIDLNSISYFNDNFIENLNF